MSNSFCVVASSTIIARPYSDGNKNAIELMYYTMVANEIQCERFE